MNNKIFFDTIRAGLIWDSKGGHKLQQTQVDGIMTILNAIEAAGIGVGRRAAYILATVYHECDKTFQPIEEYSKGRGRTYGYNLKMDGKKYYDTNAVFYGRGYVQLTWYENYAKAGQKLNLNLLQHPELAMVPDNAAKILVKGMIEGWFTGRKLGDYFSTTLTDNINARRIINSLDRAELIAGYAAQFKKAFELAQ